jgi:signal transduction histidine kinase
MQKEPLKTKFAPAERANSDTITAQSKIFSENKVLVNLMDALSQLLVILNKERQIVYANNQFLKWLNLSENSSILGKRPGEAINCIYASLETGGCGTSEFCRTCGAINSILEAQVGIQSTKECRILTTETDALDLRVTSTLYEAEGEKFTIFAINDISHEKRRQILERVFFHDVLNSAGGISGLLGMLQEIEDQKEMVEIAQIIKRAADNMIDEIQLQRQLSAAERGDLGLDSVEINSLNVLNEIKELYSKHDLGRNKNILIHESSEEVHFISDKILLRRILGNMIKNALEATLPGKDISLYCSKNETGIKFSVHNESNIPGEIQHQVFQRSFSTKGLGRGLGTYSMKLLGEKYLKGKVWFESSKENGTTFYIKL